MGDNDARRSTTTVRSAKLLALSIGGGAALTLLGAGVAHADDAANASTGTATSQGGNADSTGNQSASDQGQTLVVAPGSDPTIVGIDGTVSNAGAGVSNSGANFAVNDDGESSQAVHSGNANSAGNQSHSKMQQGAVASATGGGLTIIGQDAHIRNWGGALANSGFNSGDGTSSGNADAWGNRSWSWIDQSAVVDDASGATRLLTQEARIANLGLALANTGVNVGDGIVTGNASAGGNDSQTGTAQSGIITDDIVGIATLEQAARTRNLGAGVANSGINQTTGDDSTNDAKVFQDGVLVEEDPEP